MILNVAFRGKPKSGSPDSSCRMSCLPVRETWSHRPSVLCVLGSPAHRDNLNHYRRQYFRHLTRPNSQVLDFDILLLLALEKTILLPQLTRPNSQVLDFDILLLLALNHFSLCFGPRNFSFVYLGGILWARLLMAYHCKERNDKQAKAM